MSEEMVILAIISVIFFSSVIKLWIKEHYSNKKNNIIGEEEYEENKLAQLSKVADKLEKRVESLEAILNRELPGWEKDI